MTQSDLPESLGAFIHDCIPHVDAAEVLLLLARDPERAHTLGEIVDGLRALEIGEATAKKYLTRFQACGFVTQTDGAYRYTPESADRQSCVSALGKLYHEMPVTLVRMIYAPRPDPLREFADAFKIKK